MTEPLTTIFRAGAVRDAAPPEVSSEGPVNLRPGAVAVREGRIVAVGETSQVEREAKHWGPTRLVDLPDRLILPAMVNVHAHLDLTDIGPVPYESVGRDFIKWIEMVMARRPKTEEEITRAVRNGLRMSREAGVGWIGDIAGSDEAVRARINDPGDSIPGVSYLECFGIGKRDAQAATDAIARERALSEETFSRQDVCVGLQPHAPYSAGPELYEAAHNHFLGLPSTHLAETREEIEFVRDGRGAFAELLQRIGKWDESIHGTGLSPIQYLEFHLNCGFWIVAHCNYVSDDDLAILARAPDLSVAFCPIASEYFGHTDHRYRDMLSAKVNVCLGTDSILCQPSGEEQPLGIMPQMRRLYRRDATDPGVLLRMGTVNGWRTSYEKHVGGMLVVGARNMTSVCFDPADPTDALTQVLLNDYPVEPLPEEPVGMSQ